jgi:hypothetical protein
MSPDRAGVLSGLGPNETFTGVSGGTVVTASSPVVFMPHNGWRVYPRYRQIHRPIFWIAVGFRMVFAPSRPGTARRRSGAVSGSVTLWPNEEESDETSGFSVQQCVFWRES